MNCFRLSLLGLACCALCSCTAPVPADDDASGTPAPTPTPAPSPTAPANCTDLNCDGWPDIVFANTEDENGSYDAMSYIYWGSDTGFSPTNRMELPTLGAMGVAISDLDKNGWPDVVFASVSDGTDGPNNRYVDSRVYWGSAAGFSTNLVSDLPTIGAADITISDLNLDGWDDLIFSNRYNGGSALDAASYSIDSYIYWGSSAGFSETNRSELPTVGAGDSVVADFNQDSWPDIVFAHGTFHSSESWLYWGGASGFSVDQRMALPSDAPEGVQAGDLNGDGLVDLFIANFYAFLQLDIDSSIFLNQSGALSPANPIGVATHGATAAVIEDLNGDGAMDLIVSNSMTGSFFDTNFVVDSTIHWGNPQGLSGAVTNLPTTSASDVEAGDLDKDGDLDLVFSNHYDASGAPQTDSVVYWNDNGFDPQRFTALPTLSAAGLALSP